MIREPKNKNEETFLKEFGEKEFDAVITYEDDLYSRSVALMNEMNKEENKKELNSLIKDFCNIPSDDLNFLKSFYSEILEKEKNYFSLCFDYEIIQNTKEDNYCDSWKMHGRTISFAPISLSNIIRSIHLECTRSRMCIDTTPLTTGMSGLFNDLTVNYHNKEQLVYFYAQISLVVETYNDRGVNIPVLDLFFGDDEHKWLIQKNTEKDYSDIPFYPNITFSAKIKGD